MASTRVLGFDGTHYYKIGRIDQRRDGSTYVSFPNSFYQSNHASGYAHWNIDTKTRLVHRVPAADFKKPDCENLMTFAGGNLTGLMKIPIHTGPVDKAVVIDYRITREMDTPNAYIFSVKTDFMEKFLSWPLIKRLRSAPQAIYRVLDAIDPHIVLIVVGKSNED